jgi:hypothetical protein
MAFVEYKTCLKQAHAYLATLKQCPECKLISQKRWTEEKSEHIKTYKVLHRAENDEHIKSVKAQWYQDNKEEKKAYEADYRINNRGKHRADRRKYKAAKRNAVPPWLTKEQLKQIQRYYDAAHWATVILEELIVVDHVVPLQGKNIRGLHVPWNLQLLTEEENCRKGNKYDPNI